MAVANRAVCSPTGPCPRGTGAQGCLRAPLGEFGRGEGVPRRGSGADEQFSLPGCAHLPPAPPGQSPGAVLGCTAPDAPPEDTPPPPQRPPRPGRPANGVSPSGEGGTGTHTHYTPPTKNLSPPRTQRLSQRDPPRPAEPGVPLSPPMLCLRA